MESFSHSRHQCLAKIAKIEAFHYSSDIIAERHTFLNSSPAGLKTQVHETYQMGITIRDPGSYYVGETFYKVARGTFFCFHPGIPHASIGNLKNNSIQGFTMYISGKLVQLLNVQLCQRNELPYFRNVFYDDPELSDRFTSFFNAIWLRQHELASYHLHLLFCRLIGKNSAETLVISKHAIVTACQSYVFARLSKPISVNTFANLCGMSVSTLCRIFQRSLGMSPHVYISQLRVEAAKDLLKCRLTIKQIALLTGHYDESHLRKNFKQYVGVPPAGYKPCK
jgi:AraC-like DNA-binding protein